RAYLMRAGEQLGEYVARKLLPEGLHVVLRNLTELRIEHAELVGELHEMQQDIGVHDQQQQGGEREKGPDRQLDVEERQLDRSFEKQIAMGHAAGGDRQVKQHEQIADP